MNTEMYRVEQCDVHPNDFNVYFRGVYIGSCRSRAVAMFWIAYEIQNNLMKRTFEGYDNDQFLS
jgi:hypothetical protein